MPDFEIRREGDCATVIPAGDVVASSVAELRPAMRELVSAGVREMIFDLANARMLDSMGLGLLLSAHNSLARGGGKFSVSGASEEVIALLRAMRVHQHFPVTGRRGEG